MLNKMNTVEERIKAKTNNPNGPENIPPVKKLYADYSCYPRLSSETGEYLCASGYFYAKAKNKDGSDRTQYNRPVYMRIHLNQTLPFQLPELPLEEVCERLRLEARRMLWALEHGKIPAVTSSRHFSLLYDESGSYAGPNHGEIVSDYKTKEEGQLEAWENIGKDDGSEL